MTLQSRATASRTGLITAYSTCSLGNGRSHHFFSSIAIGSPSAKDNRSNANTVTSCLAARHNYDIRCASRSFRHKVDVGPRTTHDVLEVALAEITCLTGASSTYTYQQLASGSASQGNWLSPRHFAENAALGIDVVHFASVVYEWCLSCIPGYCRTVDPRIQQPTMS